MSCDYRIKISPPGDLPFPTCEGAKPAKFFNAPTPNDRRIKPIEGVLNAK